MTPNSRPLSTIAPSVSQGVDIAADDQNVAVGETAGDHARRAEIERVGFERQAARGMGPSIDRQALGKRGKVADQGMAVGRRTARQR